MENIDALNEEKLSEYEIKFHEKYQKGLIIIKQARERLLDHQLRCMICLTNRKNIVIQGCNHFNLCDECVENLESKICPRCQRPFVDIIKINV